MRFPMQIVAEPNFRGFLSVIFGGKLAKHQAFAGTQDDQNQILHHSIWTRRRIEALPCDAEPLRLHRR